MMVTAHMPPPYLGWARCTDAVADVLRRGAWYPILEQSADGYVVEVRGQRVRLRPGEASVRHDAPDHWSVVVRTGVLRPTLGGQGRELVTTYAVCPQCHERQDFAGKPPSLRCGRCQGSFPVDWSRTC